MSTARVTFNRTLAQMKNHISSVFIGVGFLSVFAVSFAHNFLAAEGGSMTLATVWATAVAPFLPGLSALFAMDSFSEERRSGRIDMLLSAPIKERDLTIGKTMGVFIGTMTTVIISMLSILVFLVFYSGPNLVGMRLTAFVPALLILSLQAFTWCAISVLMSSLFIRAAVSAAIALVLIVAMPRGLWIMALYLFPAIRSIFGEMPLDSHVFDFSSGIISVGTILGYLLVAAMAIGLTSKSIASLRLRGIGGRNGRLSIILVVVLSMVMTMSLITLAMRLNLTIDCSFGNVVTFSARTRDILSESNGKISIRCFMSRNRQDFRSVARFLRELKKVSASVGANGLTISFVDPNWDIGAAQRLVWLGAKDPSLVIESGRHTAIISLDNGADERAVASAIQSVIMPPRRKNIYWTFGHGEVGFDQYDQWGMSDIARELSRDGYNNHYLDLTAIKEVPNDCAFIIIVGAKRDFSIAELSKLDAYLKCGGRLMVLMSNGDSGGVGAILPSWGVRVSEAQVNSERTLNGSDIVISDFAEHSVSAPLKGSSIVMGKPLAFTASSIVSANGADKLEFTAIAKVADSPVVVAVERGGGTGDDLAIRPTRIIVIGDMGFVFNSSLKARANANRDFFMNAVAYLAGTDMVGTSGISAMLLNSGMECKERIRMLLCTALWFPLAILIFFVIGIVRRRKRE